MKWFALFSFFFSLSLYAQEALQGVYVEEYYHINKKDLSAQQLSGPIDDNAVTYRVFLDLAPGCRFQAAYGSPSHPLLIQSNANFFNHAEVGNFNVNVIPERMLKRNLVALDSWLSVGAVSENLVGIPKENDVFGADDIYAFEKGFFPSKKNSEKKSIREIDGAYRGSFVAFPTFYNMDTATSVLGSVSNGKIFQINNGAWACLGKGSVGVDSLGLNMVLIGQFTTSGGLDYKMNVMIRNSEGKSLRYVYENPQEGETVLPCLKGRVSNELNNKKKKSKK
jgi:hypothetical protein